MPNCHFYFVIQVSLRKFSKRSRNVATPLDRQQHLVLAPDGSASVRGVACRVEVTEEELGEAVMSVQKQRWTLEITQAWLSKLGKTFGAFGGLIVTPDPESEGGEFLLGEGIVLLGVASSDGAFHRMGSLVVLWSGEIVDETKEWRIEAAISPVLLGPRLCRKNVISKETSLFLFHSLSYHASLT